ncbi:MAG: inorganic phosphate transporter [Firmicutes bacterium]|nr:inorganic phosphate transporter [Bacillota bacterium]
MDLNWMVLTVILTFAVIFVNGWTDAPNAISTVVATGGLTLRQAAFFAAICNCLGVAVMVCVSPAVAWSVGSIINMTERERTLGAEPAVRILLCAALLTIVIWSVGAWYFGIPTSESHSLIAAMTGAALAFSGVSAIRWEIWGAVVAGLVGSVVLGFCSSYVATFFLKESVHRRRFLLPQMTSAMAMAFMHGAQDGQKFLGILLLALQDSTGSGTLGFTDETILLKMAVICAAVMGLGTLVGGGRIVETMGRGLVELDPREGCAADGTAAGCLLGASLLGFPVSTTHVKAAAVLGAGLCGGRKIDGNIVKDLGITWLLTFPGCLVLGYVLTRWFMVY